jgi:membrane-bound ClpP family serine protease
MQLSVFAALSIIMVVAAWKFFKKNPITSDQPLLNIRAAQYVGKTYGLETAIAHGTGRIRIGDTTWKVEGSDMPSGATVRVTGFDGAILKVEMVGAAPAAPEQTKEGDDISKISTTAGHRITDPLKDSLEDPLTRKS